MYTSVQDPRLNFCPLNQSVQVLYRIPLLHVPYVPTTNEILKILFEPMIAEYFETPTDDTQAPPAAAASILYNSNGPSVST